MYPYQPKPLDLIISIPFFALSEYALSRGWDRFSFAMFITGWVCVGFVALASLWSNVIEHNKSIRDKMDTARHLDLDRLAAIGLASGEPKQTISTRVSYEDRHGNMEKQTMRDIPISPVKMQTLANHILSGVPFSRKEWVEDRKLISDGDFRKLQEAFKTNGIVALRDPNKPTMGYEFTPAGRAFLRSAASLPSPTPSMETAENEP